jgi:hypothetical protein
MVPVGRGWVLKCPRKKKRKASTTSSAIVWLPPALPACLRAVLVLGQSQLAPRFAPRTHRLPQLVHKATLGRLAAPFLGVGWEGDAREWGCVWRNLTSFKINSKCWQCSKFDAN